MNDVLAYCSPSGSGALRCPYPRPGRQQAKTVGGEEKELGMND